MTEETLQAIQQAAADPARLRELVGAAVKADLDKELGVAEVTAGLKAAKAAVEKDRDALRETVKAQLEELEAERRKQAEASAKAEAATAGVDHDAVEKMATERAEAKLEELRKGLHREMAARVEELETRATAAEGDRELLVDKYRRALADHQIHAGGGNAADPVMYKYLAQEVSPFLRIRENGSGEPWWKAEEPRFDVIDPLTETRLDKTTEDGKPVPMTPADLIGSRRAGEWSRFFPPTGTGGGMSRTVKDLAGKERLEYDPKDPTSATRLFASAYGAK
jgi:hypothetical protein